MPVNAECAITKASAGRADMRIRIIAIVTALLLIATLIYLSFDKIAIYTLSKIYSLDISYKSMEKSADRGYIFEDLRLVNKKMGLGFFSSQAILKPEWKSHFLKSLNVGFKFKNVHFIKIKEALPKPVYGTTEGLVSIPFEGRWTYKDISGDAEIFSNGITLKKFAANGREIRLLLSGDIYYNNVVDTDLTIYFSKDVLKEIPPEFSTVIMRDELENWKSFFVKIKGNYRSPSMQISGKSFRLNIGTVVMKD